MNIFHTSRSGKRSEKDFDAYPLGGESRKMGCHHPAPTNTCHETSSECGDVKSAHKRGLRDRKPLLLEMNVHFYNTDLNATRILLLR